MDRYQRVDKPKEEVAINENEIRITSQGRMRNYISYATTLLQEKKLNEIVFKAMGRAISKTVMCVEIIKKIFFGLHQNTSIMSADITDTWEPLEEGLLPIETTRHVSMIAITLSTKKLDDSSTGYQTPLPCVQVQWSDFVNENEEDLEVSPRERERGRGRGRASGDSFLRDEGLENGGRGDRGRGRASGDSFLRDEGLENGGRGGRRQGWASGDSFLRDEGLENGGQSFEGGHHTERENGRHDDYQYEAAGYNAEAPAPAPVRGRGDYQYEAAGYNAEEPASAPVRGRGRRLGRGRGRGRGRSQNRGTSRGFRPNGSNQVAAVTNGVVMN